MKRLIAKFFHGPRREARSRTLTLFKAPRRRKAPLMKPEVLYERPPVQA